MSTGRIVTNQLTGVEAVAQAGTVTAMNSYDPVGLLSEQTSIDKRVEHARLRDAVVEAAKARRRAKLAAAGDAGDYIRSLHAAMRAEHAAVDALIEFEAKQDQKD